MKQPFFSRGDYVATGVFVVLVVLVVAECFRVGLREDVEGLV